MGGGLKPKGILHNLNADFWPQREVPERVSYATNLEKVGISAFHEVPAVENVSGTLTGTLAGGQLDASAQDFMLHLAKVFPRAVALPRGSHADVLEPGRPRLHPRQPPDAGRGRGGAAWPATC